MSKKIDFDRDHVVYFPEHEGAMYEQDGVRFDSTGNEIGPAPDASSRAEPAPRRPRKPAEPPAEPDQLAEQLSND